MKDFIAVLRERDLVAQLTHEDELREVLAKKCTVYCGFDPTAESLHIGHLLPILTLARWQRAGHKIIMVMGGGTALIGDPTGKTDMRKMLTESQIDQNALMFAKQVKHIIDLDDPERGVVVDNATWLRPLHYLPFLREIGSQFSVNRMLTAECFRSRLEHGLSFLEFNYMLLQAYDFLHLFQTRDCAIQIGGDDQWSNMLAGVDLVRRVTKGGKAFCITFPLLETSDGRKMGKTEQGAVWLDPKLCSPYDFFQFWRNVEDKLVGPCLRRFTFLSTEDICQLEKLEGSKINDAKIVLAFEVTKIVHGEEEASKAQKAATQLFSGGGEPGAESGPTVWLNRADIDEETTITDVLVLAGVAPSKGEARRLVQQGGIVLAGHNMQDPKEKIAVGVLLDPNGCLLRKGKKHYYNLRVK